MALSWPAFGMPTIMPNCCGTSGLEAVASMRPNSSGGPWYLSRSGRIVEAFTVCVGNLSARTGTHHAGRLRRPARRPASPARWRRRCRRARGRDSAAPPRQQWCARPDRRVQIVDRRLFEAKRLGLGFSNICASSMRTPAVTPRTARHPERSASPVRKRVSTFPALALSFSEPGRLDHEVCDEKTVPCAWPFATVRSPAPRPRKAIRTDRSPSSCPMARAARSTCWPAR